jgi:hypothetical protein
MMRHQALLNAPASLALLFSLGFPALCRGDVLGDTLAAEVRRNRIILAAIPASPLVDGERPRLGGLLDDVESLLKAQRLGLALETLSSIAPGVTALVRAGAGWDDTGTSSGKHIDDLVKEGEGVGRALKANRDAFPKVKPRHQSAFVRAMAEQSFGQIDEYYEVAVDYGRFSGVSSGAYYLGRAEGQMAFALLLSGTVSLASKGSVPMTSLAGPIAALENDIVTAYAKPGSTAQHGNFIIANSSLKLARELDLHGWRLGSLVTLLRSLFALSLATLTPPSADEDPVLAAKADEFEKHFAASTRDDSVGEAFVEKARLALEKSRAGGDGAERERLRAAALLDAVIPRYLKIMEGFNK